MSKLVKDLALSKKEFIFHTRKMKPSLRKALKKVVFQGYSYEEASKDHSRQSIFSALKYIKKKKAYVKSLSENG